MIDYDLPMIDQDKNELLDLEFMFIDNEKNDVVNYMAILKELGPKQKSVSLSDITRFVVKIQALARGVIDRKLAERMRNSKLDDVKANLKGMSKDAKGSASARSATAGKKLTKEERKQMADKKKAKNQKDQRLSKRSAADPEKRLDGVIRPPRDAREVERKRKAKIDLETFIKEQIIESLVTRAHSFGESLQICKDI